MGDDDIEAVMNEMRKLNSTTRAVKLLDYNGEFVEVKNLYESLGGILAQCRLGMAKAYSLRFEEFSVFRDTITMVKGIKKGMNKANNIEEISKGFAAM